MKCPELSGILDEDNAPVILDVRLADDFEAAHLPDAINIPVMEVRFNEAVPETLDKLDQQIVIYGANDSSQEARMALEKLQRAGYQNVSILEGGIGEWTRHQLPLEQGEALPSTPGISDGSHPVDVQESYLRWTGKNLLNNHTGTVSIAQGELQFQHGKLIGGVIEMDLARMQCDDLQGSEYHDVLIQHLQDHDFFDVSQHPTSRLEIRSSEVISEAAGSQNLLLTADLTIKSITHPLEITAATGLTPEGKAAAQASFSIDRTKWNVIYGSGKWFHRLAGHLVNDEIDFQVKIVTA